MRRIFTGCKCFRKFVLLTVNLESCCSSTIEGAALIQRRVAAAASLIRCRVLWLHPRSQANIHPHWPVGDQLRALLTRVHGEGGGAAEAVAPGAGEGVADRCRPLARGGLHVLMTSHLPRH